MYAGNTVRLAAVYFVFDHSHLSPENPLATASRFQIRTSLPKRRLQFNDLSGLHSLPLELRLEVLFSDFASNRTHLIYNLVGVQAPPSTRLVGHIAAE
jgi:hypothetical protein